MMCWSIEVGQRKKRLEYSHDERLVKLLQRAREVRLKFNKDKLHLHLTELVYIGYHIFVNGLRPDPDKGTAITQTPDQLYAPQLRSQSHEMS